MKGAAGEAQLTARWTVIDGTVKEAPYLKESRLTRPAKEKSTDGSVAALSETVADLTRDIAKTVIAIDRQRET
jgi:ABC-type transport auxiliary lipoprotein component